MAPAAFLDSADSLKNAVWGRCLGAYGIINMVFSKKSMSILLKIAIFALNLIIIDCLLG